MESSNSSSKTEFDNFANDYDALLQKSISASGYEAAYFDEHKIKTLFGDYKNDRNVSKKNVQIMNFGCGTGKSEKYISQYFTDCSVCSVDVSEKSIDVAKQRNREYKNMQFLKFDKVEELAGLNKKFDIIGRS